MSKVTIIYGSSGGNTELVCQHIEQTLKRHHHRVVLRRVETCHPRDIRRHNDVCLLAAPTYEHGIIQHHFKPFLKALRKVDLKHHPVAIIGLGDDKYDNHYNIESANILEQAVKAQNGELICHGLRINRNPVPQLHEGIQDWAEELCEILKKGQKTGLFGWMKSKWSRLKKKSPSPS